MIECRYDAAIVLALGERACLERGEFPGARNIARRLGVSQREVVRWRVGVVKTTRYAAAEAAEKATGVPINLMEHGRCAA